MNEQKKPKVSIGIPIYWGEIYLQETLESILNQTFQDFEIIIADNNPGGIPERIATMYSEQYETIKYIKHTKNVGALQNWNSLIKFAQGEYFIYAGGHDLWSENLMVRLVEILDFHPNTVNAYAPSFFFDKDIQQAKISSGFVDTSNSDIVARTNQILWAGQDSLYGLIRMAAIKKTRLQLAIVGSGAVWLSELSLYGDFVVCCKEKRFRRINRYEAGREARLNRYHKSLFSKQRKRLLPFWRIPFAYLTIPKAANIPFKKRFRIKKNLFLGSFLRYDNDLILDITSMLKRLLKLKF